MKQKIKRIIFLLAIFFMLSENVFGVTNTYITEMTDSKGQKINRHYNGKTDRQLHIGIGEHSSNTTAAYCLDVGAPLGDKAPISKLDLSLEEYLSAAINDSSKSKNIANKINQYMQFGYNYNNQNSDKYFLATQKLIWDELYNAGYRQDYYDDEIYFTAGEEKYDISTEEEIIKNNITNYYKTPSMCSNTTKLEIAVGETAKYEDTNKVLSNYTVTCDEGLICQIDNNILKITANTETTAKKIRFHKKGLSGTNNIIYKRDGEQAVLVNAKPLDEISCEFGVDTYTNVQTSDSRIAAIIILGIISATITYIIVSRNQYINAK